MRTVLLLCAALALDAAAAGPVEKMMDVQQNVQPALAEKEKVVPVVKENGGMEREVTCAVGWSQLGSRCFKFFNRPMPWADAESYCLRYDANLASIHSMNEYAFVQNIAKSGSDYLRTWVGGTDAVKESQWFWSDGSKFNYAFWGYEEPNNLDGEEHCLEINYGDEFAWNDFPCKTKFPFVCVIQAVK